MVSERRRQFDLGLLGRLGEPLRRDLVLRQVDALLVLELDDQPVDDLGVPVVTTEMVVAGGRLHLEHALADVQQRDVERAAAEVEDQDRLVVFLVQAVRQRSSGRLVDDPGDIESGDLTGLLGRLPLRVGEVRRHRDHRIGDRLAEIGLRVPLQLLQHERRDLLRRERLVVDHGLPVGAHMTLHRTDGPVDVGHRLPLCHLAGEHLAVLGEGDYRRSGAGAFGVGENGRLTTLQHRDDGVCRTEVDTDRTSHGCQNLSFQSLGVTVRPRRGHEAPGSRWHR